MSPEASVAKSKSAKKEKGDAQIRECKKTCISEVNKALREQQGRELVLIANLTTGEEHLSAQTRRVGDPARHPKLQYLSFIYCPFCGGKL